MVEIVVVGDESVDSKVDVESRRVNGVGKFESLLVWVLTGDCFAVEFPSLNAIFSDPSPNTDMKDGREANNDCELVDVGIVLP